MLGLGVCLALGAGVTALTAGANCPANSGCGAKKAVVEKKCSAKKASCDMKKAACDKTAKKASCDKKTDCSDAKKCSKEA